MGRARTPSRALPARGPACQSEANSQARDRRAAGVAQKSPSPSPSVLLRPEFGSPVSLKSLLPSAAFQSPALVAFSRSPRCHPALNKSLLPHPLPPTPAVFGAGGLLFISTGAVQECPEADLVATCSASPPLPARPVRSRAGDPAAVPSAR